MPTPQTPFITAPMPTKRISPTTANTSNPLFNSPHALKTHFTQCLSLQPPFQLPSCPQNIFHTVPTPETTSSTASMPSKHISPNANTSDPRFNCPHARKTHFTRCQHLKPPFQLPPCPQNIFHTVVTSQTPFSTTPMPSKQISPCANTSNPLFNCPHALKTHFTQCQHLKPPFQLPPCSQNTFHPPRGRPSANPTASNAGLQGRTLWGRCWVPRPHRPHPEHTGRGTPAARPRGRAAGGGTAPDTTRPSQQWQATPPGTAPHHPRGTQPAQGMQAKGTVMGPHTHTPAPAARG